MIIGIKHSLHLAMLYEIYSSVFAFDHYAQNPLYTYVFVKDFVSDRCLSFVPWCLIYYCDNL